jgi:hypothetical protein
MDKKVIIGVVVVCLLLITGGAYLISRTSTPPVTGLDDFAKCLDTKGAVMYGAAWCSHCQNTKKMFGDSFKYIKYVECPVETKLCLEKQVGGYPTWIFADGTKLEGEQTLQKLSEVSSCPLTKSE